MRASCAGTPDTTALEAAGGCSEAWCPLFVCLSIVEEGLLGLLPVSVGPGQHLERPELSLGHCLPRSEDCESMETGSQQSFQKGWATKTRQDPMRLVDSG